MRFHLLLPLGLLFAKTFSTMLSFSILPPEEKDKIKIKKRIRLAWVWGGSFFFILSCFTLLLVPSYFLSSFQREEVIRNLMLTEESPLIKRIADIRKSISVLQQSAVDIERASKTVGFFSDMLSDVMQALPHGITPTAFELDGGRDTLLFYGIAENRAALVALETALKSNKRIENISVPLSNLVQDAAISFSLTVMIKKQ